MVLDMRLVNDGKESHCSSVFPREEILVKLRKDSERLYGRAFFSLWSEVHSAWVEAGRPSNGYMYTPMDAEDIGSLSICRDTFTLRLTVNGDRSLLPVISEVCSNEGVALELVEE